MSTCHCKSGSWKLVIKSSWLQNIVEGTLVLLMSGLLVYSKLSNTQVSRPVRWLTTGLTTHGAGMTSLKGFQLTILTLSSSPASWGWGNQIPGSTGWHVNSSKWTLTRYGLTAVAVRVVSFPDPPTKCEVQCWRGIWGRDYCEGY